MFKNFTFENCSMDLFVEDYDCVWVPVWELCSVIGISSRSQIRKIKANPEKYSSKVVGDNVFAIGLEDVNKLLFSIRAGRVSEDVRGRLQEFRANFFDQVHFWLETIAPEPDPEPIPVEKAEITAEDVLNKARSLAATVKHTLSEAADMALELMKEPEDVTVYDDFLDHDRLMNHENLSSFQKQALELTISDGLDSILYTVEQKITDLHDAISALDKVADYDNNEQECYAVSKLMRQLAMYTMLRHAIEKF